MKLLVKFHFNQVGGRGRNNRIGCKKMLLPFFLIVNTVEDTPLCSTIVNSNPPLLSLFLPFSCVLLPQVQNRGNYQSVPRMSERQKCHRKMEQAERRGWGGGSRK